MSDDPLIGTILADRYRVDRLIGEGAMGRVYLAEHVLMRKRVALKVLHRELMTVPEIVQRFEREARAAAHIEHAHVAGATDFGKLPDGSVYLVLEFVEGLALSEVMSEGPLPVARALTIALQVTQGVEAAHQRGIVHRDLKPDNLLLVQTEDKSDFVKVLDFGIAKVPTEASEGGQPITQVGMVYGTPEYMAPEQALGQDVDARADLYALGVILYEMLTGRRPYQGPAVGLLGQQLSSPLPKMAHVAQVKVPAAVEQLVVELLAPDPKRRIGSAAELRGQLEALGEALAQGKLAGADNRAGTLLSVSLEDVTTRIEQVTRNIPKPVTRAVKSRVSRAAMLALAFGAVGVIGAITLVGAFVGDDPDEVQIPTVAVPPPPVLDVPDESPEIDEKLGAAREAGLSALEKLAEEYPAEGRVHAELSIALAKAKRYEDAVDAARVALALDPQLNEDPKVAGALFRSTQSVKARSASFRLLKGAMGSAGVGIIYDLARTDGVSRRVQAEANRLLKTEEVRSSAAPGLLLVLDLERAKSCEKLAPLVKRAALVGDKRALPLLEKLQVRNGCGPGKKSDCYPCLRKDDELLISIQTIKQRATLDNGESEAGAGER